jgi:hypothetical protein
LEVVFGGRKLAVSQKSADHLLQAFNLDRFGREKVHILGTRMKTRRIVEIEGTPATYNSERQAR